MSSRGTGEGTLYRLAAFAAVPGGGNPAGVWIGSRLPGRDTMQRIARELGYSETAFIAPTEGTRRTVRYFSPAGEVSFCGHATIASGVVLGRRSGAGDYELSTPAGDIPVSVTPAAGDFEVALRSVAPEHEPATEDLVDGAVRLLGWAPADLDPEIPPARVYAGAWHLVLAAREARRLDDLDYDIDAMQSLMQGAGLTTLQLIWRESDRRIHARNPFAVGGVFEDPATGASAAALGGYLRDAGLLWAPATFEVIQGVAMGCPSRIIVDVPEAGGVIVRGTAVDLTA